MINGRRQNTEDFNQIGLYLKSKIPRIGEDFISIAKAVLTPEIKRELINMQVFKFTYFDSDKFPRQRLTEIEKIINKQISGILDKSKMYTVDVFPEIII